LYKWLLLIMFGALISGCTGAKQVKPVEPAMSDSCPICGMMPAKYPGWKAQIIFKDGSIVHFDSPKDMLKYLRDLDKMGMEKVWIRDKNTIAAIFVTDYATKKYIDARKAYYVKGSAVQGPMGEDLVPFTSRDEAERFVSKHGGSVITYGDITVDLLKSLAGMKMGM
jgi:nitrous oxide reductase accessory protein NosL